MRALFTYRIYRLCLPLLAGLVAACASTPPAPDVDFKQDYDFSNIRTIALQPDSGGASGSSAMAIMSDMEINRINDGLADALTLKGLEFINDASKADALIAWHLIAQDKTDIRTYNTGPTYGGGYGYYNRRALYNCWNCGGTQVSVRNYTEGTFIVDIIDPKLNQSVWRAVIQSKLKEKATRDQAAINAAAGRVLASFPPY